MTAYRAPALSLLALSLLALPLLANPAQAARQPKPNPFAPSLPPAASEGRTDGAIFAANSGYVSLVAGSRARGVGDVLTILLAETTSSTKTAGSKTQRTGTANMPSPTLGPLSIPQLTLNAAANSSFNGAGNATQTNAFSGTIAVTIAEVRPNGTALVRGEKRMLLSQGHEWIQFSGIVRLADIDATNSVASGQVADARIEYAGDGAIQRSGREGWLSKFFNMLSPF
jgi:flagellar L-ring protein precursor FlgH